MKFEDRKKFSIHLDVSQIKASYLNYPLSTKRKDHSPISPNTSFLSDHKFKPVKPLKTTNHSLKKILSDFKLGKENSNILKNNKSSMSKFPLLVDQFARLYNLNKNELQELNDYKQVYYYKSQKSTSHSQNGDFLCFPKDHIRYQYEVLSLYGQGSFGQVYKVFDHKTAKTFALKIIKNQDKLKKQAALEASILHYIKDHDTDSVSNIVKIHESFIFREHQCIVFEKLDLNLYDLLKQSGFRGIEPELIRKIAIQILNSLNYLTKFKIVHCDIKPENVMLQDTTKSGIRLVDFGSSCFFGQQIYTYIQSRYYRAPEVIFGLKYGSEIDMWSFACLIAELHLGTPIFPGEDEVDQVNLIMQVVGPPSQEFALKCPRRKYFFDEEGNPKKNLKSYRKLVNLNDILHTDDEEFVDFLMKCFRWEASERLRPLDALKHPWVIHGLPKDIQQSHKRYVEMERQLQGEKKKNKLQELTKKLSEERFIKQTKHSITQENKSILSGRYSKPTSIERTRSNIALSIHNLLSGKNSRKPSFAQL